MNKERAIAILQALKINILNDNFGEELLQALDIAIESLDNEWVDVRDRLPENDIEVLVTEKYFTNEVTTNRYLTFLGEWETCTDKVIAWKPLPQPYERKE